MFKKWNTLNTTTKAGTPIELKYVEMELPELNKPLFARKFGGTMAITEIGRYEYAKYSGRLKISLVAAPLLTDALNNPDNVDLSTKVLINPDSYASLDLFSKLESDGPPIDESVLSDFNDYFQNLFNTDYNFKLFLKNGCDIVQGCYQNLTNGDVLLNKTTGEEIRVGFLSIGNIGALVNNFICNYIEQGLDMCSALSYVFPMRNPNQSVWAVWATATFVDMKVL